jgi:hypothetical protein
MSEPTPLELRFPERCRVMLDGVLQDLPAEIAPRIRNSPPHPDEAWWWCSIYGTNNQSYVHPKFWEPTVSSYFIKQTMLNHQWTVGFRYCPGQREKCSGHIYGDAMARLMQKHHLAEGFRFGRRENKKGTQNLWLEFSMPDAAADAVLRPKLAWLIRSTWPDIQAMLKANAT